MGAEVNPLQSLYDTFNNGTSQEKWDSLPDFPRMLDVELTSACNFGCLQCPTGNKSLGRKAEFMADETIYKIVTEAGEHDAALRFIGWGEPLLHPRVVDYVSWAHVHGLLTHLNTNGSKLSPTMAAALVGVGLSSIKLSFQGVDRQSYLEMRRTDFFEGMIRAIEVMREARRDRKLPYIAASTSITYESEEQVAEFRARLEPLVDHLSIGHTTFDFMDMKAVRLKPAEKAMLERLAGLQTVERRHPDPCPEVFDKLSIHADGSVRVCCNDYSGVTYLGNVNETPIAEMWRHPQIEDYRRRLAKKEYGGPLCSVCFDYQSLTAGTKHVSEPVE